MFNRVAEETAGHRLSHERLNNDWEGGMRTIAVEDFAIAFRLPEAHFCCLFIELFKFVFIPIAYPVKVQLFSS
jgi:hypothetical protein